MVNGPGDKSQYRTAVNPRSLTTGWISTRRHFRRMFTYGSLRTPPCAIAGAKDALWAIHATEINTIHTLPRTEGLIIPAEVERVLMALTDGLNFAKRFFC